MKKLIIPVILLSLKCTAQDTIKLQSDFAMDCLKAQLELPKYKKIIEKKDSVILNIQNIYKAKTEEQISCDTLNKSLQNLNDKLSKNNDKNIHDSKWKVYWRRTSMFLGSLLLIENGTLYLIYKK